MYVAQRYTGLIAFAYIVQHVIRQRFMGISLPENPYAAFHKVQVELSNPWMVAVYAIAMIAICWHFSYGLWLFAAKWGITPGEQARKRFGYVCLVLGVLLAVMGLASIWAFVGGKYPNVPENVPAAALTGRRFRAGYRAELDWMVGCWLGDGGWGGDKEIHRINRSREFRGRLETNAGPSAPLKSASLRMTVSRGSSERLQS